MLKVVEDKILVTPINDKSTSSQGLVLESREGKPEKGEVIAVGPGRTLENGSRENMDVKVGDIVYFTPYAPDAIDVDGKNYYTLKQSGILAIIEK